MAGVALLAAAGAGCGSDMQASEGPNAVSTERQQGAQQTSQATVDGELKAQEQAERRAAKRRERALAAERRKKEAARRKSESRTGGWTGVDANNYEIAELVCGSKAKEGVARDLGLSPNADEFEIAEAYADGYRESFQQANFEGCLKGLGVG